MENIERILEDLAQSGKSIVQYCKENNLKPHSIRYWRQKLKKSSSATGFVPVNTQTMHCGVEIYYPNGVHVKLAAGFSLKDVKSLVDV
jgi:hypothetical protein